MPRTPIPYSVFVAPDGGAGYSEDTWLEIAGNLDRRDEHYVLIPAEVTEVAPPADPYLY